MKLVTLAEIVFNRLGSASGLAMVSHKEVRLFREVDDASPEGLKALIISIAETHGENAERLKEMWQENSYRYGASNGALVFNIQGRNVQYSTPYALCRAFPALKIDGRYFKLDEVET